MCSIALRQPLIDYDQIDCVVTSIKPQGVFCEAGPLTVFVSKLVRLMNLSYACGWLTTG